MKRRTPSSFAIALLALTGACTTITSTDTQPLVTAAAQAQSTLRTEATAIDTAYNNAAIWADTACDATISPPPPEAITDICKMWEPPPSENGDQNTPTPAATPGRGGDEGTGKKSARTANFSRAANRGTRAIVAYVNAIHAVASANDASVDASARITTRLKAATGLVGGATGPFSFLLEDGFGAALKIIAQAVTAHEVNATLGAATADAQIVLDVYALAMRETLGACDVPRPAKLLTRVDASLASLVARRDGGAALSSSQRDELERVRRYARRGDRCQENSLYVDIIKELHIVTRDIARNEAVTYEAILIYRDLMPSLSAEITTAIQRIDELDGLSAEGPNNNNAGEVAGRFERVDELERARAALAPYEDDSEALAQAVRAAAEWRKARLDARANVARQLFALANAHAAFRERLSKTGGVSISALSGESNSNEAATDSKGE